MQLLENFRAFRCRRSIFAHMSIPQVSAGVKRWATAVQDLEDIFKNKATNDDAR
jgi:hypothetical protein